MNEWLTNLKVGDQVVVSGESYGSRNQVFLSTVEKLTQTLIFTKGGMKFRRRDGHSPGTWATGLLLEPTPDNLEQVREHAVKAKQAAVARRLREYAWHKLPLETLQMIEKLLPKST